METLFDSNKNTLGIAFKFSSYLKAFIFMSFNAFKYLKFNFNHKYLAFTNKILSSYTFTNNFNVS